MLIGIHIRKDNLFGTIPLDNPSIMQIRIFSKQLRKQESFLNQLLMSQLHMAQIFNLNLYVPVLYPSLIVNKLFAEPEFVTLLMYKKEEPLLISEVYGYYEAPTIKDELTNFENFENSQRKYWEEEDYMLKQCFIYKERDEQPPNPFIKPQSSSQFSVLATIIEYQNLYF